VGRGIGAAAATRPNILFILADDLGYGDLSCYGRPDYRTPVLDGLARQGMTFTSAYAAAPVCTPTRTALLDAARVGAWKYLKESGNEHLFDVVRDPGEKADLRAAHPDVFARIKGQFLAWNHQVLPKPPADSEQPSR
jgi:hypothetical protein